MGQLFDRITRVCRAELNSNRCDYQNDYLNEGTALVTGGSIIGASIGKVGILAGGTGYSLGTVPLTALGALTGAALYEALRSLLENDPSSISAAMLGATAGAATSAAIGGVGIAVSGGAIGVGMASMAAGGAVIGLGFIGLNRLLQQGIDPEKLLDSAIEQMETDLRNLRQASINVIASQKRLQQQCEKAQAEVNEWERRVQLALQKGEDDLAWQALNRKKMHSGILSSPEVQIDQEPLSVKNLKQNLMLLEAKTMRINLKAQIVSAKINAQLDSLNTSSAMTAFECMEDKVLKLEARSQAAAELAGADLESQFAALESSDVDLELEAMKQEMMAGLSQLHRSLPEFTNSQSQKNQAPNDSAIDTELEDLKRQLDNL
jgi:phage shock protein A